jgi:hypothetical protein
MDWFLRARELGLEEKLLDNAGYQGDDNEESG